MKKRKQIKARSSGKSGAKKKKSDELEDKKGEELKILNPDAFLKGLRKDVPEVIRKFRAAAEGDASKEEDSDSGTQFFGKPGGDPCSSFIL